jgi:5-methylcytosine-specific restriction enzyme A
MPTAAKTPCKGCGRATRGRLCDVCREKGMGRERRKTSAQRGYNAAWQRASKAFLRVHPLCADPYKVHGERAVAAECTDHIKAHKGDMTLFWDPNNWQPLCLACNSRKAVEEEGAGWRHA